MKLVVERGPSTDMGTFGDASLKDGDTIISFYKSLELPWRDNKSQISCIPAGSYHAKLFFSPHFQSYVYLLDSVPGRSDVEIHPANWAGDVSMGFHSDLRGCLTLGEATAVMSPPDTMRPQRAVTRSAAAVGELKRLAGDELDIEIHDGLPAA